MNLSSFVSKNMVTVNLRASTKRAVIAEIVGYLCSRRGLANRDEILQAVLAREETTSTGIGEGVAIPHARLKSISEVHFFVGISKTGVDFGAPDGKASHIIILFVTPEAASQTHLKILSAIGNLEKNRELLAKLIGARTDLELFQILNYEQVQRESYFPLSSDEVLRELGSQESGLTDEEARKRLTVHGQNRLLVLGATPRIGGYLRSIVSFPNLLPWIAAILAFLSASYWIGGALVLVILLGASASILREWGSGHAVDALRTMLPPTSRVVRDGKERRIPTENLVPGDILLLDSGDTIAADGRLIEAAELKVDNNAFSGDSKPVYKSHDPIVNQEAFLWLEIPALVFGGTTVVSGRGKVVVTATGMNTEIGQIAYLTQTIKGEPETLSREIGRLFRFCSLAALVILAGAALLFSFSLLGLQSIEGSAARTAVTGLILAATPLGFLPLVTILLFAAGRRIRRRGAQVKRLSSVEAVGGLEVICTDKTGTLTTGEMCVERAWVDGKVLEVSGRGYEPDGSFKDGERVLSATELSAEPFRLLFLDSVLCNDAQLLPPASGSDKWRISGDPTEGALLVAAAKGGMNIKETREARPVVRRFPFDAIRKRMSSIHEIGSERTAGAENHLVLVKGAPREVLRLSSRIITGGRERTIDQAIAAEVEARIDDFAADGLRVLGFALRRMNAAEVKEATVESAEQNLTFLGLTAMVDPPRPDAPEAIRTCRHAGIRVVMVTGEYELTALSIARKLGIVPESGGRVVTGTQLSEMNAEELRAEIADDEVIFARVNPEHRLRIVGALKATGKIVGATGDGIADAPTLKRADIGIAMGRRGNEVTRATAEMILTGDSFAAIVQAVHVGRAVFEHLRRVTRFVLAHILPQGFAFVLFLLFGVPLPLALAQILIIDLVIEMPIGLSLAFSPLDPSVMTHPVSRHRRLLDRETILRAFLWLGLVAAFAVGLAFFVAVVTAPGGRTFYAPNAGAKARTIYYAAVVAAQIAVFLSVRRVDRSAFAKGGRLHPMLPINIGVAVLLLCASIYVPFFQNAFSTSPPDLSGWGMVIGAGVLVLLIEELRKLMRRRYSRES